MANLQVFEKVLSIEKGRQNRSPVALSLPIGKGNQHSILLIFHFANHALNALTGLLVWRVHHHIAHMLNVLLFAISTGITTLTGAMT